jgi:sRNA-binding regulator protein Hfq
MAGRKKKKKKKTQSQKKVSGAEAAARKLIEEHPELSREQAAEIVSSGLTHAQWLAEQEAAREARRRENLERKVAFISSRHPQLREEQILEIIRMNVTPEQYLQRLEEQERTRQAPEQDPAAAGPLGRRRAIDELLARHPELKRAEAGQIVAGQLTLEQLEQRKRRARMMVRSAEEHAEAKKRLEVRWRALEERAAGLVHLGARGSAHLEALVEARREVEVGRFHGPAVRGVLRTVEPYRLLLEDGAGRGFTLAKLKCTLLYPAEDAERIGRQLQVDRRQAALRQHAPYEPEERYQVPDELLRDGEGLGVMLHNGWVLNGEIRWFDHFHLGLELPGGGEVLIFSHGVLRAQAALIEPEEGLALAEHLAAPPAPSPELPTSLPLERIRPYPGHDDYPVKDWRYEEYREHSRRPGFELPRLKVRRHGEQYYLADGYRRLTLARELGYDAMPVEVI